MVYSTIQDLIDLHGEDVLIELSHVKKRGERPTSINETVVLRAIASGDGIIDSYISKRESLPIDSTPSFINTLSIDLATYYLHKNKGNTAGKDNPNRQLYDDAITHLERFANGETNLGLVIEDPTTITDEDTHDHADISSADRQFTRSSMSGLT